MSHLNLKAEIQKKIQQLKLVIKITVNSAGAFYYMYACTLEPISAFQWVQTDPTRTFRGPEQIASVPNLVFIHHLFWNCFALLIINS